MASVPSAGCLLAKNQYYRRRKWSGRSGRYSAGTVFSCITMGSRATRLFWLPELIDKYWWIKSFFHSEPSPPAVGRKTLSAS
ncbi:Pancreatic progenitor cell differentiation and proliferation factor-like, partial [Colius striatus]